MLKNIYIIKIKDKKVLRKLIRYGLYFEKIAYFPSCILVYLDNDNYEKALKYKSILDISLYSIKGKNKVFFLLKKYYLFIISNIIGLMVIFFLSNIIFSVKIMTNDKEIYNLLDNELTYYGIKKYNFVKTFKEKEIIKEKILNEHKDKLEWMEITRNGTNYTINVERRIINDINKDNSFRNVVAKKNAFIKEIKASNGSIMKKINDYVNKGEVIVSGIIYKNDKIMDYTKAEALIYGETWYDVKVTLPINYYEKIYTGQSKKRLSINFLNKKLTLFKPNYINYEIKEKKLIDSLLLPFSISYDNIREIDEVSDILTNEKAWDIAFNIASKRLLDTLSSDSKILSQKKLKFKINNSTIEMDVFFKVYENITDYQSIQRE